MSIVVPAYNEPRTIATTTASERASIANGPRTLPSLSIAVPAYNEAATIAEALVSEPVATERTQVALP